jgi:hypothetical protein
MICHVGEAVRGATARVSNATEATAPEATVEDVMSDAQYDRQHVAASGIRRLLPPDQLARFRRWFTAFEAGRTNHAEELDSAATKLGRLAGRAFAELKKRAKEP